MTDNSELAKAARAVAKSFERTLGPRSGLLNGVGRAIVRRAVQANNPNNRQPFNRVSYRAQRD